MVSYVMIAKRNSKYKINSAVGNQPVFIFDVDQCLYSSDNLIAHEHDHVCNKFINSTSFDASDFLLHNLKFNNWQELFYSVCGLHPKRFQDEYDLLDFEKYMEKDIQLIEQIKNIKYRKFCFSNGTKKRVEKILKILGMEDLFETAFCSDTEDTDLLLKPKLEAFQFVQNYIGATSSANLYFFDDNIKNVAGGKLSGWNCYHINKNIKKQIQKAVEALELKSLEKKTI
ncbi:hypothetical protein NUSPORA_01807 [Nucleospora cyclopteri]